MKYLLPILLFCLLISPAAQADFRIFDGTGIETLPKELYDEKIPVIDMAWLFSARPIVWPKPGDSVFCTLNPMQIQAKAREHIGASRVVLDIEGNGEKNADGTWKYPCLAQYLGDDRVDREAAIDRYLEILAIWKDANPDTRVGFYGVLDAPRLTAKVDDLYPSAYWDGAFPADYAKKVELMRETARLVDHNKPLYPFIWYRFRDNPVHQAATFQFILETMYAHTDGVVLWAQSDDRGTEDVEQTAYMHPQNSKPMGWQARWLQRSGWQSRYLESQWMYVLRDFRQNLDKK